MIAHVTRVTRGPLHVWWWFFTTDPHLFSVYYKPTDDERRNEAVLMQRFFDEQLAKVREYLKDKCPGCVLESPRCELHWSSCSNCNPIAGL